jgi:hypothetical protein
VEWSGRAPASPATGVCWYEAPGGQHSAKKFLGFIYQHYLGKSSAAAAGLPLTDAQSVRSYFTTGLAELILDDRAAATKQRERPVLNSDPFIGHAEWYPYDKHRGILG